MENRSQVYGQHFYGTMTKEFHLITKEYFFHFNNVLRIRLGKPVIHWEDYAGKDHERI